MGFLIFLVELAIFAAILAGGWKAFVKAGLPGWAFIVPIYNLYLMWQMTTRPFLYFILCFIPFLGIIPGALIMIDVAKAYGKGTGMGIALLFGVGWPFVGFGDAIYSGKPVSTDIKIPTSVG